MGESPQLHLADDLEISFMQMQHGSVWDKNMQEGVIANVGVGVGLCERVHYNAYEWVVTDILTTPKHI